MVSTQRRVVRKLDQLNLARITVVTVNGDVPRQKLTGMIGQQHQYVDLERCKIVGASGVLPQQAAQAQWHDVIVPSRVVRRP